MHNRPFVIRLIQRSKARIRPHQVMVFNVVGNYGHYQVRIGGEDVGAHTREVEITGDVHHLFLTKDRVSPLPDYHEVERNLKGTVLMRDVRLHIKDPKGDGSHVVEPSVVARETLNLAGEEGKHFLEYYESSERLINEMYRIVQGDILKSLFKLQNKSKIPSTKSQTTSL